MKDLSKDLYMIYVMCKQCYLFTPIYSTNIDSLEFNYFSCQVSGLCLLCDESINRD